MDPFGTPQLKGKLLDHDPLQSQIALYGIIRL